METSYFPVDRNDDGLGVEFKCVGLDLRQYFDTSEFVQSYMRESACEEDYEI